MTTTRTAAEELKNVLALAEKATPGAYRYVPSHIEEGPAAVRTAEGRNGWAITFASDADAALIAAAVNFIRVHTDTLRAALKQEKPPVGLTTCDMDEDESL